MSTSWASIVVQRKRTTSTSTNNTTITASTLKYISDENSTTSTDSSSSTIKPQLISNVLKYTPSLYVIGGLPVSESRRVEKLGFSGRDDSWTNLAPIPVDRSYFAGVVLNGLIYVIGGRDGKKNVLQSIDRYNPTTNSWTTLAGIRPVHERSEFGAAAVKDRIYLIGGYGDACRSVECFDVALNQISERRSLERGRWGLGVVACRGKIYACGGQWYKYKDSNEQLKRQSSIYLNDVESYDPVLDRWVRESGMLRRRGYFGLGVYEDSVIYAVGGVGGECNKRGNRRQDSIEKYDTYTGQWSMIRTQLDCGISNLAVTVVQYRLVIVGGTRDQDLTSQGQAYSRQNIGANFRDSVQIIDLRGLPPESPILRTLTSKRHSLLAITY